MVTAETAIVMPAVVVLLALVMFAGTAVIDQVRCVDAARAGARLAARGEGPAQVMKAAGQLAPEHARIALSRNGSEVRVTVSASARAPLTGWAVLPLWAFAVADVETALDDPGRPPGASTP